MGVYSLTRNARSPFHAEPGQITALLVLFLAEHWIPSAAGKVWVVIIGVLVFAGLLSWFVFGEIISFFSFVPLLSGVFLDVIYDLAKDTYHFRRACAISQVTP
jgi:hypothetical protein